MSFTLTSHLGFEMSLDTSWGRDHLAFTDNGYTFDITCPTIEMTIAGIARLDNLGDDYRLGFIQYVTSEDISVRYETLSVVATLRGAVMDGGIAGQTMTEKVQLALKERSPIARDMSVTSPWYDPPLILNTTTTNTPPGKDFYFNLWTGDRPGLYQVPWRWPADSGKLNRVDCAQRFVTCAVLWDNSKQKITLVFGRSEWSNKFLVDCKESAKPGARLIGSLTEPVIEKGEQPDLAKKLGSSVAAWCPHRTIITV